MNPISIDKIVEKIAKENPGTDKAALTEALNAAVKRKNQGERCTFCDEPIWAVGSAVSGTDLCFTCVTGESDSSDDYEIDVAFVQN
ncbi:hypothetical protein CN918_28265 [Priestia megaterium]|nr:hypothetical protein CN918_28265 [Priestia megaterium]